ncbi:uncharacterized protein TRIVIDRAFT_45409 [Trichoderma virens Gv29-8]|uniref:DUF3669 domain-containing protein n=1 Tax=Hypocrea virens (strain Gv29-8 / FGSC 10586) TaxID=413071 RepID=G9MPM7_HYPVG|nr:uncharacterized protein TRIVIDRAFT_45409 [Trichoderma virens Gv29-8]EHK23828.1 hypothetical protein TRIVIDRAFT_45409 [Trichoderma virens Gv29-8]
MSYAEPVINPKENPFRKIGAGACGAVFAQEARPLAIKLAKTDDQMALENEYHKHELIEQQFRKWGFTEVRIPDCFLFIPREDEGSLHFSQRPDLVAAAKAVCHLPTSALVTQRIDPLCKRARTLLIDKYCLPRIKEAAHGDASNRDCLVRVYLGSLEGKGERLFFSLRNIKMHLNQMVDLQLYVNTMASRMGVAMALMHWAAETDARDVEFVLGSHPERAAPTLRSTELWVLDFNQVQSITMDEVGVAKAVEAVWVNDPYLPRPLGDSQFEKQAWNAFVSNYIMAADIILREGKGHLLRLPRMFIRGLIERHETQGRMKQQAEENSKEKYSSVNISIRIAD